MADINPRMVKWDDTPQINPGMVKWDDTPSYTDRIGGAFKKGATALGVPLVPAGVAMAGGEVLKIADELITSGAYQAGDAVRGLHTDMGFPADVAARAGFATNVGIQAIPALAGGGVARSAAPLFENAARRIMQNTIKPDALARRSGDAPKAIETMLEKGINATEGGMQQVQGRVTNLENQIQNILDQSPAMVGKKDVASHITKAVNAIRYDLKRPEKFSDIEEVYAKFLSQPEIKNLGMIPVSVANKMKQAFYAELKDLSFVPGADLTAAAKAQKALAGGLRAETGKAEPAIVPSLAEQSEFINVLKVMAPQVGREGNKQIVGLGALAPSVENALVWLIERYPWSKSILARTLYSGSEAIPAIGVGGTIGALQQRQQ